jgi:hypothetical protein
VLSQRKVDILRSDAQIKTEETLDKFMRAYLGGRYADGNGDETINDNEQSGETVRGESEEIAEGEQWR